MILDFVPSLKKEINLPTYCPSHFLLTCKVEIISEPRYVAFLSPNKICENLNFSREIQIFANFAG